MVYGKMNTVSYTVISRPKATKLRGVRDHAINLIGKKRATDSRLRILKKSLTLLIQDKL